MVGALRLVPAALSLLPVAVAAAGWATSARDSHRLRRKLCSDELTGLANRAALAHRFAAQRPVSKLGMLLIDLDDFKAINDTYGHAEGNTVLRHVATQLRSIARPGELPVRLHGDEFAVLLTTTSPAVAACRAEDYRAAISRELVTARARHRITASVGAAVLPAGADLSSLLTAADAAMYAAKPGRDTRRPVALRQVMAA